MSRYPITTRKPKHYTAVVGWDSPLETYFAEVTDLTKLEEDKDSCVLWVGSEEKSIVAVEPLAQALFPYATIPLDVTAQLICDRADAVPPTSLQRWGCRLFQ